MAVMGVFDAGKQVTDGQLSRPLHAGMDFLLSLSEQPWRPPTKTASISLYRSLCLSLSV